MAKNNVDRVDMVPACQDLVIILKSFFIGTQGCVGTEAVVVITNCVKREREGARESSVAPGAHLSCPSHLKLTSSSLYSPLAPLSRQHCS